MKDHFEAMQEFLFARFKRYVELNPGKHPYFIQKCEGIDYTVLYAMLSEAGYTYTKTDIAIVDITPIVNDTMGIDITITLDLNCK